MKMSKEKTGNQKVVDREEELKKVGTPVKEVTVEPFVLGEYNTIGTITRIQENTGLQLFGKGSMNPDNIFYHCVVKVTKLIEGMGDKASFNIPKPKAKMHPNSKLAKFLKRYGKAPHIGQEVKLENNEGGFWTLVI
jgi:hypothetical protein